jgi:hypothetical protein
MLFLFHILIQRIEIGIIMGTKLFGKGAKAPEFSTC